MAALETRLMLLGAVLIFQPVNGYQLRRELATWHVDEWANIAPGSIYNGLATLTKRGELVRYDLRDGTRNVAVYEVSDAGRSEFHTLFETAMRTITPTMPIAFHTALAFLPLATRHDASRLVADRMNKLEKSRRDAAAETPSAEHSPPHVTVMAKLWEGLGKVEYQWLQGLARRIHDGELEFAGEEPTWAPAADDPGWQIAADRQRYLNLLGRAE